MIYLEQFFSNKAIIVAIISWAIAQIIKIVKDIAVNKSFDPELIFSSGGMPSSHSSFVVSMAITVGLDNGFDSPFFAIAFVLAVVVMYDAAGVRRAAGKQAAALNVLLDKLDNLNLNIDERFKELLGHTPIQVIAGALLGIIVAAIAHLYF